MKRNKNKELEELLKKIAPDIYHKSIRSRNKDKFTIYFPRKCLFRIPKIFDSVAIQIQIFFCEMNIPFDTNLSIDEYYKTILENKISKKISFDLSQTTFIGDLEMNMILSLGNFYYQVNHQKIELLLDPKNESQIQIWQKWGFFQEFQEFGEFNINIPYQDVNPDTIHLIPIKKIENYSDSEKATSSLLYERIKGLLTSQYKFDEEIIHKFVTDVISEICQNIPSHSQSKGYILVHSHPEHPPKEPKIEIAISDSGIGIKQSLSNRFPEYYQNESHFEAISKVFDGNFMLPNNDHHGGIQRAKEFVKKLDGQIIIRSICAQKCNDPINNLNYMDNYWRFFPGTHVCVLLPRYNF